MKIICIGRNYIDHIKELNSDVPTAPVFFMKPDSAIVRPGNDLYFPDHSKQIEHEIELVVKINKPLKNVAAKFANRYYTHVTLGIDVTARDLQKECKEKGLPWEVAKAFDRSAPFGNLIELSEVGDINNLNFELRVNGEIRQKGNTGDMIHKVDELISYLSKYMTLKIGDLIFTGTPAGVGPMCIGDHLEGYIEGNKVLDFNVK